MSILLQFIGELLHFAGVVASAVIIRWLLELSTPARDWHTVKYGAEWLYDSIRIPDWREWFNMDRLSRLREHPDAVIVVDGSAIPLERAVTPDGAPA